MASGKYNTLPGELAKFAAGEPGQPKISDAALSPLSTQAGIDWVLSRNAGMEVGAVGSYAVLLRNDAEDVDWGTVYPGSLLMRGAVGQFVVNADTISTGSSTYYPRLVNQTAMGGSWLAISQSWNGHTGFRNGGLFMRVS